MRTNQSGRTASPAAVLLGILLVVGVVLGSGTAIAAESASATESASAAIGTNPGGHGPVCSHEGPPPDAAFTEQSRRGADPTPDGETALPGLPAFAPSPIGLRDGSTSGTRGPPNAGRVLLESLGISRT